MKMVTNKTNWTGEYCTVSITDPQAGIFTIGMEGYTFQMSQIPDAEFEIYRVRCLECPKWKWLGYRADGLVNFAACGISREDDSEYLAFAQLAWNVI